MMETELPPGSSNSTGHLSTIGWQIPGRMHHSASTPAGVDGGGSRTPPATPKKGGKMLAVRVQMLDDSISMFQIQSKALGRVLFDQVCRQLHLLEADYFGLEYQDANGSKDWLDVEKPMCRQLGLSMLEPTLRFCVKFYTPDPARLEEEFTRYLFCLQVKRDLAQGSIQCNENTAALMASYIVQAECGDFVPEDYPDHTYLSGYKFFTGQDPESERRICENHKKHIGQSPAEADLNLLETARRCELYGIKMHAAKDHEGVPLNIAVAHMGIVVFQHFTKINTFSWAKIRKISFKRKKFLIKLHPEGYGHYRDVVEFFFKGRNECKNFWKKCVENHGFFRCSSVPKLPRHKTKVLSRGSSFRYSGKTQKQIVEFVRDNYVKRQTFQRSGSFRASRSAGGSRANVSHTTPLNASVSAHPLLPLPPGSDAISLEWDKQPHYLEASLVMRGYSAEAAREAARPQSCTDTDTATDTATDMDTPTATRTPRTPRTPLARPPPPATAFASTRDKLTKLYCKQIEGPELVTHAEVNHHPTEDSPLPHRTMTPSECQETPWKLGREARARAPTPPLRARPPADELSPEDHTISSASLCMSPSADLIPSGPPLHASTPLERRTLNGCVARGRQNNNNENDRDSDIINHRDVVDAINGNVHVNVVSESTSMDVLSGGESDAGDTLNRRNNNSLSSRMTLGDMTCKRKAGDVTYYVAKELLMTERTYKRDLELLTVTWSKRVGSIGRTASSGAEAAALAKACLALEPLALPAGALLARLDRALVTSNNRHDVDEPEYRKIADLLFDYLSNTYDAYAEYTEQAGTLVALVESARRRGGAASREATAFDLSSPLPLACLLLRPLHRLLHYCTLTHELWSATCGQQALSAHELASKAASLALTQLRHVENHATLCQLQRDIVGYDKLLVAEREFVRLGCVYKHSSKGLQQRMLFLFSDLLLIASKSSSGHFRAHSVLPLHRLRLEPSDLPHSINVVDEEATVLISMSNDVEYAGWWESLSDSIDAAQDLRTLIDTQLTHIDNDTENTDVNTNVSTSNALSFVCWHRATSLTRDHLHLALRSQLSGYLLRKFKNSHGWQKLWVVFALYSLFFYKSWQDETPLASLPLLGYSVSAPSPTDGIEKDFVFKLQYKSHVYFFRADSHFTYNRWTEVLQTPMMQSRHNC
ncbi:FERM, ARHGEF and pleckstrin domain-containing protein 2 isoform X1 [Pieris brassicae]|uniref:FERM, ARHGEF and pleckstrin domain-containing protein 2 isoform X1 n=1 Tax=Pieris brassicae TaxID=7116 RepID=UPI001E66102F|nr:FERM, ARHGEF and pleckstrin domain-containing protein 2 isoform X1 [Pieris brassicae]